MTRLLYKPLSLAFGLAGSMVAGALFHRMWRLATGDEQTPEATDEARGWAEILIAAALYGATLALVKAAIKRGSAKGVAKLTGEWPD